jgi:small GTP-binding protein
MNALLATRKIVLLGDAHVGKTQLLNSWLERPFATTRTVATVAGSAETLTAEVRGEAFRFQFWDTAGAERVSFRSHPSIAR